jgi:(R)-amidase
MTLPTAHLYDDVFGSLRIGLCQVSTEEWAVEENSRRTLAAIDDAADRGADLAVTPECVLQAYPVGDSPAFGKRLQNVAESISSDRIRAFCNQARTRGIAILLGFAERAGDCIHNAAAMISPEGKVLYVYRKVHCRDFESIKHGGFFTPGQAFHTASIHARGYSYPAGAMICFDREIPESVRSLRAAGAELVLCPLATNTRLFSEPVQQADNERITQCRAAENEVYIAVVNHAGRFNGGSFVVGPSGEVVHQMGRDAGVDVVEIPLEIVRKKFHGNPLGWMGWGYRRPEVYRSYLET